MFYDRKHIEKFWLALYEWNGIFKYFINQTIGFHKRLGTCPIIILRIYYVVRFRTHRLFTFNRLH